MGRRKQARREEARDRQRLIEGASEAGKDFILHKVEQNEVIYVFHSKETRKPLEDLEQGDEMM